MQNNRRNFLKNAGLTGLGLASAGLQSVDAKSFDNIPDALMPDSKTAVFNMSGYAAPPLEIVRVGFIGVGNRGQAAVERLLKIEGVVINAICDLRENQVNKAIEKAKKAGFNPKGYFGSADAWKKLCEQKDIDLIYIATPWNLHTPQSVSAMENGKHVCVEVPAACTLEECWQLVNTSEKTKKHCIQIENCCYDFVELLTLNMAQQGVFGEIVHCEGSYIHDLRDLLFDKDRFYQMWQLKEAKVKKGNLYPTHGLGPICQVLNINRGDKMDYLVSVSSNDFHFATKAKELAAKDDFYKPYIANTYNGTINTTTIRTSKGKTMMVQYDVSSPRPYSRIQLVSGTKGAALKYPLPAKIAFGHEWLEDAEYKKLEEKYLPPIIRKIGEIAKQVGGHGGMDFLMDWRNIDCLRNGIPVDQDVYDAASWSAVTPLSVWSVANNFNSIKVPDFTRGNWSKNKPVDLSMQTGGTTGIKLNELKY